MYDDIPELLRWAGIIIAVALALGLVIVMATVYEAAVKAIDFFDRAKDEAGRRS